MTTPRALSNHLPAVLQAATSSAAEGSAAHPEVEPLGSGLPVYEDELVTLYLGECVAVLKEIADGSVDSVVTDPPYAIRSTPLSEAYRSATPVVCHECGNDDALDGYTYCTDCLQIVTEKSLLDSAMLGMQSQNWHEKATHSRGYADNDSGQFESWCLLWARECHRVLRPGGHIVAFGGTRTWHRLASAIEDAGFEIRDSLAWLYGTGWPKSLDVQSALKRAHKRSDPPIADLTLDEAAKQWEGWGTALKPAHEPIVLGRKPLEGTVAANVTAHGTGAINIDACRIPDTTGMTSAKGRRTEESTNRTRGLGRWPANAFLDETQASALDDLAGTLTSRYFWVAKPSQAERVRVDGVAHPTVKPLGLMRQLVRPVTPPGGTVLEPFAGSGTTVEACIMEGFSVVAIEREADYMPLILARLSRQYVPVPKPASQPQASLFELPDDGAA